jgi:hypothetical protein
VIILGVTATAAVFAAPGEVTNLVWCSGPKNCLQWDPVAAATEYRVTAASGSAFRAC